MTDDSPTDSPEHGPLDGAESEHVQAQQKLRLRRLGMSFASYLVTFTLVVFCAWVGLVPPWIPVHFLIIALFINAVFLVLTLSRLNLRLRDPSMTAAQMIVSLIPALYVMYFLDQGQARAVFMVIAIIPALYGMLALNTRQFIAVGAAFLALYGLLMAALWTWRPDVLNASLELFQALALMLVIAEIAMIGGYISGLREKLRRRNGELREALERIGEMARRDSLTGLFNRRHLMEILARESNRYSRAQGPFSVGILDIDHFKQINDHYGHQAGDLVLKRMAGAIGTSLRNIDCFGRFGGEEFLLILPQTPLEGAAIKAERVRELIASLEYPEISPELRVTASIGVAQYLDDESIDDTISRADDALYQAKAGGRNQCLTAPHPVDAPLESSS